MEFPQTLKIAAPGITPIPFDSGLSSWQHKRLPTTYELATIEMTKPELGVKRDCPECGARFYDLNKEPAHCPKCDHEFIPEALLKPRKSPKEEAEAEKTDDPAKPAQETSLESADKEQKAVESKKRASLDDDENDDDDDELADIEDIDIADDDDDDDDDNDDNLLVDDDDNDVTDIVKPTKDDD
ncbi:MAG: TIGR02300 family protein [Pseudomonadota bacterium]